MHHQLPNKKNGYSLIAPIYARLIISPKHKCVHHHYFLFCFHDSFILFHHQPGKQVRIPLGKPYNKIHHLHLFPYPPKQWICVCVWCVCVFVWLDWARIWRVMDHEMGQNRSTWVRHLLVSFLLLCLYLWLPKGSPLHPFPDACLSFHPSTSSWH